jgi:hypothetical protein
VRRQARGRTRAGFTAALAGLSFATIAAGAAGGPAATGARLGVRSGFAVPAGAAFDGSGALADTNTGYFPLRLDLGVRLARPRFGVMVGAHLLPAGALDPWIGGMGYELLSVTRSAAWSRLELQASGLELFDLELGLDLRPTAGLRVGPVLSTSIGRYTSVVLNGRTTRDFDAVVHGWGMVGIRGAYDL